MDNLFGVWLVFPQVGDRPGEGGDAHEVISFGDDEAAALREANRRGDGYRAVYVLPGQTISEAWDRMEQEWRR